MFETIPFFHRYNPVTKKLTLRGAEYIPEEIFSYPDEIEMLDLSHGTLATLPDDLARLTKLRILFCSQNLFTTVPLVLARCQNLEMVGFKSCHLIDVPENSLPASLRWLVLTDNQLTSLPESMGELTQLRKLSLAGNQLTSLPDSMQQCKALELIRLGANQFKNLPTWLQRLPNLAWYGDAGNPLSYSADTTQLSEINWNDLVIGELLGESPTSQVYQAILKSTQQAVAVKLYKTNLTSDGYPVDDMIANVTAGEYPNIASVLGRLTGEPNGRVGLVRSLIPQSYRSLGLPPSLNSCTRDVYPPETQFTKQWVETVLANITAALQHLHERGIMHGDLYAHNILVNDTGHALLGDFGAASLYQPGTADWREQMDQRALRILEVELSKFIMTRSDS